ncbi:MAG: hypothetical protein RR342_01360 [Bacilli bacterium]
MPKYMKDARLKAPRKREWEDREPSYKKKSNYSGKPRSDHKHYYERCIVRETIGNYVFISLGNKCKYCDRYKTDKFIFSSEIPEEYKDLPVVEVNK